MKVLTVMLLLGPLAGFAWMWSQCYLAQLETSRLREENVRLRQQVEYTTRINHNFAEGNARGNQARLSSREALGPLFEETRQETTADSQPQSR